MATFLQNQNNLVVSFFFGEKKILFDIDFFPIWAASLNIYLLPFVKKKK